MNDVRIYDKNMKLKTTIPAKDLNKRYWDQFNVTLKISGPLKREEKERLEKEFREKYGIKTRTERFTAYPEKPEKEEGSGSQGVA
jgi:hypothetical protein